MTVETATVIVEMASTTTPPYSQSDLMLGTSYSQNDLKGTLKIAHCANVVVMVEQRCFAGIGARSENLENDDVMITFFNDAVNSSAHPQWCILKIKLRPRAVLDIDSN